MPCVPGRMACTPQLCSAPARSRLGRAPTPAPPAPPCRRKENLQARVQAKIDKKKSKRDKKLLRAGFEGRKAGPIKVGGKGK